MNPLSFVKNIFNSALSRDASLPAREENAAVTFGPSDVSKYCAFGIARLNRELEVFALQFDAQGGPRPDPTRQYTSQLHTARQIELLAFDPEGYFKNLPPFVQAFLIKKMEDAAATGSLDMAQSPFIKLWVKGVMKLES